MLGFEHTVNSRMRRDIVWEVQRGTAFVGLPPQWMLGNRERMGSVTRGNKVNPATIAIGQQQLDRPFVAKFVRSHLGGVQRMQY